ncbi:MCE family protein [Streptomyces avermitilis]|uniref:Mce(Mammalian cell entry)-related protein n=2 Tax=Streptomyces avermitilis TaxID=33903 RepID=Q82B09_STRAW|nr:putative mce(mammalian cell entry)-related protein [Streptomyces avermitilis MA-4680 = NBRC 14893]BBJ54094.1 ABC transporter substrate-binding protein [Streptomyces avermitilis]GDY66106.1 ABC transporter substrate-binding protein [Streptomyces avermitilis]GDY73674.1 ABC transporter substrate-binding protein [Streptomyces avermitilis]
MKNLKRRVAVVTALALVAALTYVLWPRSESVHVTAYFPRTVGIYPGSDVRVLGVRIGEVEKITPEGDRVRVELKYDEGRRVPADSKAAIINSSVVSDRYVQLLPVYRKGPVLRNGAVIPESRTAVPVELDRVFGSLHTTADALGPQGANKDGSLSRLLGVSADNLDGQGENLNRTVEDLSQAVTTLSDGRKDLFGTVRNLQVFTAALSADDKSVRSFNTGLAEVAGQLAGERKDLADALKNLGTALGDVSAFVKNNKRSLNSNVKGLSKVTKVLVTQRAALAELLEVAPTGLSNLNNAYNPSAGTLDTRNNAQQAQDPAALMCSVLKTTGDEGGKNPDCKELKKLFDSLPKVPQGSAVTGTVDRTLGGILGASA